MENENSAYKSIFKSTFLFGFVQVFNILAKVGLNKVVAILLGPEGMGIIGLFQSTINILKTALGLGISQSAVRDISEAKGENNPLRFATIISVTKRIIWLTALLGAMATIVFASYLSKWTFGNTDYTIAFIWVSIAVFLNILSEGQLAILKGVRQLKALAKASLLGSVIGVVVGVPFYYLFKMNGIVPSLIVSALSSTFFAWFYLRKIKYDKVSISFNICAIEGIGMIKMGIALMYVSFLGFVTDYIIRSYIANVSNIEMVGIFQAGATIITGYFGIIMTAMFTDYYPRISAINKDNEKLIKEMNRQSEVGLMLIGPLVVLFMFLMPLFVRLLYSEKFLISIDYLSYAVFGTLITICSNAMGIILLAKQKSKVFVYYVTITRVLTIIAEIIGYRYWGLMGVGITTIISAVMQFGLLQIIMRKMYRVVFHKNVLFMLFVIIIFSTMAFFIKDLSNVWLRYGLGVIVFILSILYSEYKMRTVMNINILTFIKNR
ncbi:O-antigen translocase [Labilibaculum sp.]|uniref:O-antigen translocase n=1 Tax=Labilibaculum sp. TaxID=2060723 RepID=UPI002AA83D84|nr:O-antigen translocase [Labilibaculum sp.]